MLARCQTNWVILCKTYLFTSNVYLQDKYNLDGSQNLNEIGLWCHYLTQKPYFKFDCHKICSSKKRKCSQTLDMHIH
jgi:hypothetical protein